MNAARSFLYVPGNRPDRFDKAAASGADAVILDLEDAVPHAEKTSARDAVAKWLSAGAPDGVEAWVRVNPGALLGADTSAVVAAGARALSLPKASLEDLEALDAMLGETDVVVSALIETADGVLDARAIASAPRVVRLQIGEADLSAELGVDPSTAATALAPMRAQVVLASAAARLLAPVGPISTDFRDLDALRASTLALKALGFSARAAIHPAQVAIINEAFTPSPGEVAAARRLLELFEAAGSGVCLDDEGRMVDEAIVRRARQTLASVESAS